jgi:DHA2 family multidrug resistance protein
MEVLDTTIALVALRYIAGGLAATVDDGEWVITSYLAANAFILPITGWLSAHLGRRNYFLVSIAIFTLSSLLWFRVIQGLAGGGLQPSSQGVLLDAFPIEKQGMAMTLFGLAALIAPIVGPTLGGWITDSYSWRWIFLINVPVGLLALAGCYFLLREPDYLIAQRAELRKACRPAHRPGHRSALYRGFGGAGLLGDASSQPRGEFSSSGRTQLRGLLPSLVAQETQ